LNLIIEEEKGLVGSALLNLWLKVRIPD